MPKKPAPKKQPPRAATGKLAQPKPLLVKLSLIDPDPQNIRKANDPGIAELAASIRAVGLLQRIQLRHGSKGRFQIIAGHRRYAAAKLAGLKEAPCEVRSLDDAQKATAAAAENLQRVELSPLQAAHAIARMAAAGMTDKAISDAMGRPISWVARRKKLSDLAPEWIKAMEKPNAQPVTTELLLKLARLPHTAQRQVLEEIDLAARYDIGDYLAREITRHLHSLDQAPFPIENKELALAAKALICSDCPKRSGATLGLFDAGETKKGELCLDGGCWATKHLIHIKGLAAQAGKGVTIISDDRRAVPAEHFPEAKLVSKYSINGTVKSYKFGTPIPAGHTLGIDHGAGKLVLIERATEAKAAPGKREAGVSLTLAQKRKGLEHRRLKHVAMAVAAEVANNTETRLGFAALVWLRFGGHGTSGSETLLPGMPGAMSIASYEIEASVELWERTKDKIRQRWDYAREGDLNADEIAAVAAILKLDFNAMVEAAKTQLPEPASWAKAKAASAAA